MNRQQRQELEDMVRQLADEPYNPSEKHIEEIKQRALEEYEQIMAAKQKMKEKRKGTLRRVVVTAAAIICLLVGSTVIALLNPLQSGNADNFIRRAVIWVNDQLHLGIELSVPNDSVQGAKFLTGIPFDSIDEAFQEVKFPFAYLNNSQLFVLQNIDTGTEEGGIKYIALRYKTDKGIMRITSRLGYDTSSITVNTETTTLLSTAIGDIIMWETNSMCRGIAYFDNTYIIISADVSYNDFIEYCKYLDVIS